MKKRLINSQLTNLRTYYHVLNDLTNLAENVFNLENLPPIIDKTYVNRCLLKNGAIAFFYDDVLKSVVALPFDAIGYFDIYGRPTSIMARAVNGKYYRKLEEDEFVIMWDNTSHNSIYPNISMRAERIAMNIRTEDVNIVQQRTPRIWKTTKDKERTLRDMLAEIDGMEENIAVYDSIDIDDMNVILAPAPYVVDKLDEHLAKEYASFYQLIGVSSVVSEKRERLITDEVKASLGGTIASRYSRYSTRLDAVDKINKKWGLNIKVSYYDGLPSSTDTKAEDGDINVLDEISA